MDVRHDTPLLLDELGRRLPVKRHYITLWRWAKEGIERRDMLRVKLETFGEPAQSTLENFWRMQLRLDASRIVRMEDLVDGVDLCLAMCGACEKFHKFTVQRTKEVREEVLKQFRWRQWDDYTWLCEKCGN